MTEETITADPQQRFQDFLKAEKYRKRISQMAVSGATSMVVDFEDLSIADQEFAQNLIEQPDEYVKHANHAAHAQLQIEAPEYAEETETVNVRFKGLPTTVQLRTLGSAHLGNLAMVEGIIVRATPVNPMVMRAVFKCKRCGVTQEIEQSGPFLRAPFVCSDPACGYKGTFDFVQEESTFIDFQRVRIQERPEDLPPGQLPRWLNIRMPGRDLVDLARPGDHVAVVGMVRAEASTVPGVGKQRVFRLNLDANHIDVKSKDPEALISAPEQEKQIHTKA